MHVRSLRCSVAPKRLRTTVIKDMKSSTVLEGGTKTVKQIYNRGENSIKHM